jgi:hypothetical protein
MTIPDIKKFIGVIGAETPFSLICDNAYEFEMNKAHNWLIFDEANNTIHSLCNNSNTMENKTRAAVYTSFNSEMVQYCQAALTENELEAVVATLLSKGLIVEEVKTEIEKDMTLVNVRDKSDPTVPADGIKVLS